MGPAPAIASSERNARRLTIACSRIASPPMDAYNPATLAKASRVDSIQLADEEHEVGL
jgi:hypothetical protein